MKQADNKDSGSASVDIGSRRKLVTAEGKILSYLNDLIKGPFPLLLARHGPSFIDVFNKFWPVIPSFKRWAFSTFIAFLIRFLFVEQVAEVRVGYEHRIVFVLFGDVVDRVGPAL